jgi:hypothetical protein
LRHSRTLRPCADCGLKSKEASNPNRIVGQCAEERFSTRLVVNNHRYRAAPATQSPKPMAPYHGSDTSSPLDADHYREVALISALFEQLMET